ncbi:tripartite motif-containing protein 2-like [Actinia tenebrosa]|uniref:Tripartite motif-containing protein 2-like n=1 Tax=Actinia tenebrosa TaxID=6105 RepID=A0A6P8INV3_ACTTE|nr:tripartite motif-containing protein 2-like [Actinia tenebrosa]
MASRSDPRLDSFLPSSTSERMDLCCPVCLEDFEEPKILPNCKHNVCSHCLENMTRRKPAKVLCPVCRNEFPLDQNSVRNLVTNSELMEIVNQSKDERQKERLAKAFELCIQKMGDANKLLEDHTIFTHRRQEYADQLKSQILDMAEKIIEKIREKQEEMCLQVQKEVEKHEHDCHEQRIVLETLVADSSVFISKVEDILNSEEEITSEARKDLLSESQKIIDAKLYENLAPYDVVTSKFSPNMSILSKVEKEGFGRVYTTNASSFRSVQHQKAGETSVNQPKPLEAHVTVKADDLGLEYFAPLSLATDGKKYIAVADPSNSSVLLLDNSGQMIKRFKPPGKNPSLLTFSGVAFTKTDDELLAVCGSTEVFYLSIKEGSFKMTYRTNEKYGVRYCFATVAADGRILLTCEPSVRQYRSCIFVYRDTPFGKPDLMFGLNGSDNRLEFPFKALYHENEYFVSDMEKGCILVYDEQGRYRRHFGGKERDAGSSDGLGSSQLVLPTGMAMCAEKGCFYVCDWGSSSIQVYKPDGKFIAMFTIEGRPTDIVLLDNGTVVISSKDDQWIKFYTFPPFSLR